MHATPLTTDKDRSQAAKQLVWETHTLEKNIAASLAAHLEKLKSATEPSPALQRTIEKQLIDLEVGLVRRQIATFCPPSAQADLDRAGQEVTQYLYALQMGLNPGPETGVQQPVVDSHDPQPQEAHPIQPEVQVHSTPPEEAHPIQPEVQVHSTPPEEAHPIQPEVQVHSTPSVSDQERRIRDSIDRIRDSNGDAFPLIPEDYGLFIKGIMRLERDLSTDESESGLEPEERLQEAIELVRVVNDLESSLWKTLETLRAKGGDDERMQKIEKQFKDVNDGVWRRQVENLFQFDETLFAHAMDIVHREEEEKAREDETEEERLNREAMEERERREKAAAKREAAKAAAAAASKAAADLKAKQKRPTTGGRLAKGSTKPVPKKMGSKGRKPQILNPMSQGPQGPQNKSKNRDIVHAFNNNTHTSVLYRPKKSKAKGGQGEGKQKKSKWHPGGE
jgi:hypothetical protein